jgi:hypothetical protein
MMNVNITGLLKCMRMEYINKSQDKSQNVWAEHSKLTPPNIQLRRFDDGRGNRFYYHTNNSGVVVSIGITSLLSLVLPKSKQMIQFLLDNPDHDVILNTSSSYGTLEHICNTDWVWERKIQKEVVEAAREIAVRNGRSYDMIDKDMLAFMKFVEDYNIEPILCEAMLLSEPVDGESYALTLDLLGFMDIPETTVELVQDGVWQRGKNKGLPRMVEHKTKTKVRKLGLVDYKSNFLEKEKKSFFESHAYQLIGAQKAVKHNFGLDVEVLANYAPNSWEISPSYSLKTWNFDQTDYKLFDLYVEIGRLKGYFNPSGKKFIAPDFNSNTRCTDYRLISYKEFAEEMLLSSTKEPYEEEPLPDSILSKI